MSSASYSVSESRSYSYDPGCTYPYLQTRNPALSPQVFPFLEGSARTTGEGGTQAAPASRRCLKSFKG